MKNNHINTSTPIFYWITILVCFITVIISFIIFLLKITLLSGSKLIEAIYLHNIDYLLINILIALISSIILIKINRHFNSEIKNTTKNSDLYYTTLLNDYQRQIDDLNKMYAITLKKDRDITEFFTNITHELKTPISIILGAIQLMEATNPPETHEKRRSSKHQKSIKHNCYRLLRLINNILDITKMDSGFLKLNLSNCNIVYLVEEIVQSVSPYAKQKGIAIEFDTEIEEIITSVDIDKIERIILNLLSNAIKFTPKDGNIFVNVSERDNHVIISVKDSGVGIPKDKQREIFDRFKQVNSSLTREFEGSGIGLSLVKSFIDMHNGKLNLTSEENIGSEFIIELPIKNTDPMEDHETLMNINHYRIIDAVNVEFSDIYSVDFQCSKVIH